MMKIVHSRRRVHTSYMDRFQSPQLNKQIGSSLNLMYLAVPVAYGADSGHSEAECCCTHDNHFNVEVRPILSIHQNDLSE